MKDCKISTISFSGSSNGHCSCKNSSEIRPSGFQIREFLPPYLIEGLPVMPFRSFLCHNQIPKEFILHTWHIDWMQHLDETGDGWTQLAVTTDRATRMTVAQPSKTRDALSSSQFLNSLMLRFGAPSVVKEETPRKISFLRISDYRISYLRRLLGQYRGCCPRTSASDL
jgi:hypothetical protein